MDEIVQGPISERTFKRRPTRKKRGRIQSMAIITSEDLITA